jgi:hypothetical protein
VANADLGEQLAPARALRREVDEARRDRERGARPRRRKGAAASSESSERGEAPSGFIYSR